MAGKTALKPRKGGRPSQARAEQIRDEILDIATRMFLTQGYGATSIEAIAQQAGMAKRTFYHRFANKEALFRAVVERLVTRLRPQQVEPLFTQGTLETILTRLAAIVLQASLTADALALHRLMLTEAMRFPELTSILHEHGARDEAMARIAAVLVAHIKGMRQPQAVRAAEQFLQMVVSAPQRRALGLGTPMTDAQLTQWAQDSVRLFLYGVAKQLA